MVFVCVAGNLTMSGFVPFWLSSVLGESLLELLQRTIFIQKLPLGTLVIFFLWKLIILGFQKISAIIGSKASRTSDGHVFSFAAIYTGILCHSNCSYFGLSSVCYW